jgi:isopentenyl-diphosphate delta-isomerase
VCSHPRKEETYLEAAKRRLNEELGIETELSEKFNFIYKADVGGGLWEHELDHVFVGNHESESDFNLNKDEVEEIRFISAEDLDKEIAETPENFTEWFKIILEEYKHHF